MAGNLGVSRLLQDPLTNRLWECPNGNTTCQYRHCLPPGYVLKSQEKKEEEDEEDKVSLEEELEEEVSSERQPRCSISYRLMP